MKLKIFSGVLLLLLVAVVTGSFADAANVLGYPVYPLAQEPKMDGKVNGDKAWEGIPKGVGFHQMGNRVRIPNETSFRIGYTKKALYVGFVCSEPDMDNLFAPSKDGSDFIWTEDGVEVFVLPSGSDAVFQVTANAGGARTNYRTKKPEMLTGPAPLESSQTAAFKGKDFYSVEIKIPFAALGRTPKDGEIWSVNLGRDVNLGRPEHKNFPWAHTSKGYCEPDNFAQLLFHAKNPRSAEEPVDALSLAGDDPLLHLVVGLSFDEGSGEMVHGTSAIINDGKITGAKWAAGRFRQALTFEKEGDAVAVPHSESLASITHALTLDCWAYFDLDKLAGRTGMLMAKASLPEFEAGYFLKFSDAEGHNRSIIMGTAQSKALRHLPPAENVIKASGWHHIIAVYDGAGAENNIRIYVDGQPAASFNAPLEFISSTTSPLTIGTASDQKTETFLGTIDEVKVWSKALTGAEIEKLYGTLWAKSKPLTPIPAGVVKNGLPKFTWSAAGDNTGYILEVSETPDFSDGEIWKKALPTESFTPKKAVAPGIYYWRVWSTSKTGKPTAASAPCSFVVPWGATFTGSDTTPPAITDVKPVIHTTADSARPEISARWSDDKGINIVSARLLLDGKDVTVKARVTAAGISFTPATDLAKGIHCIEVLVKDAAGNNANRIKQEFAVGEPYETSVTIGADLNTYINGAPYFPIMYYGGGVSGEERSRTGWNSAFGGGGLKTEHQASTETTKSEIKYYASFDGLVKDNPAGFAKSVPYYEKDTNFLAYTLDEPQGRQEGVDHAKYMWKTVLANGHRRPLVWLITGGYAAGTFSKFGDGVMLDCYPIPTNPIVEISSNIDFAYKMMDYQKPVWFCQQAFDWFLLSKYYNGFPEGKTKADVMGELRKSGFVFRPTPAETRAMTYLELAHNAKGILWYGGSWGENRLTTVTDWPDEFRQLCVLVGEVRYLSNMLLGPEVPVNIKTTPAGLGIHLKAKRYQGYTYVIAVNSNEGLPTAPTFQLPAGTYKKVDVLFENRSMKLKGNSFRDFFEPAGVHVYRIK